MTRSRRTPNPATARAADNPLAGTGDPNLGAVHSVLGVKPHDRLDGREAGCISYPNPTADLAGVLEKT
jgi:hypothetical protein